MDFVHRINPKDCAGGGGCSDKYSHPCRDSLPGALLAPEASLALPGKQPG